MVMSTIQIRINDGLLKKIDKQIKNQIYSSRSEAIRDAVRSKFWINELYLTKAMQKNKSEKLGILYQNKICIRKSL